MQIPVRVEHVGIDNLERAPDADFVQNVSRVCHAQWMKEDLR